MNCKLTAEDERKIKRKLHLIKKLYYSNEAKKLFWNYNAVTLIDTITNKIIHENAKNIREYWEKNTEWEKYPLFLYINFPFCTSICKYCQYSKIVLNEKINTSKYIDNLIKNMEYFKRVFKNSTFSRIYVGGGTPSLMSSQEIERLFGYVFNNFNIDKNTQITFEANPASLTKEKVETLKRIGFNRISLGIQSTDKRVLKTENRLNQDFEKTKKISKEIIDNNFIFNTDLIMGLKEDTPEAFLNSFKNAISLHPDLITLYKLRPTKAYAKCDDSTETLYNHHHFILNSTFGEIERLAELNNYKKVDGPESGDGFFYVKKQSIDNLRNIRPLETYGFEPISTFGVGAFAVSGVGYSLLYRNNSDLTFNSENESYEVLETDSTPASLRYILDTISRNYSLDINKFNEYFNFDIYIKYGVEIKFLERMGKIVKTKTKINFSFNSLKEKFFYMLLFLENGQLLDLIKNEKERP